MANLAGFVRCNSCEIDVPFSHKNEHYRCDWHRYNVKRKCAELPPIAKGLFDEKLGELMARNKRLQSMNPNRIPKKDNKYRFDDTNSQTIGYESLRKANAAAQTMARNLLLYHCKLCRKTFKTRQQMKAHLHTRKHAISFLDYQKMLVSRATAKKGEKPIVNRSANHSNVDIDKATTTTTNTHTNTLRLKGETSVNSDASVSSSLINYSIEGNEMIEIRRIDSNKKTMASAATTATAKPTTTSSSTAVAMDVDESGNELLSNRHCLFCTQIFNSVSESVAHMCDSHGFFVPLSHRLISLPDLMREAMQCVSVTHQCVWCWKVFRSLRAVQTHMRSVGHCKLQLDKSPNVTRIVVEDSGSEGDAADVDADTDGDVNAPASVFWKHFKADPKALAKSDALALQLLDESGVVAVNAMDELVRYDGTVIGHRDHSHLYRQNMDHRISDGLQPSESQIIAQLNNPIRTLTVRQRMNAEDVKASVEGMRQARSYKRFKDDTFIGLQSRSHKFSIDQHKNQNRMLY